MSISSIRSWFSKLWPREDAIQYDPMKYIIAGLGNIGADYDGTRHNIGFDVVDHLAEQHSGAWKSESLGSIAQIKYKGRTLLLLKPSTYMNRSGKSIRYWLQKHKVPVEKCLVIVDDLNLDLGMRRLRAKGSDGGHNGLRDIQEQLGSSSYPRLRLGIGSDYRKGQQVDFVLGKWEDDEMKDVDAMISAAAKCTLDFCTMEYKHAMSACNGRS